MKPRRLNLLDESVQSDFVQYLEEKRWCQTVSEGVSHKMFLDDEAPMCERQIAESELEKKSVSLDAFANE